jgi:hypothetical protein
MLQQPLYPLERLRVCGGGKVNVVSFYYGFLGWREFIAYPWLTSVVGQSLTYGAAVSAPR